ADRRLGLLGGVAGQRVHPQRAPGHVPHVQVARGLAVGATAAADEGGAVAVEGERHPPPREAPRGPPWVPLLPQTGVEPSPLKASVMTPPPTGPGSGVPSRRARAA